MTKNIVVIGGITVDWEGKPFQPLIPRDSNPGTLEITYGGVARNIAENLQRMGDVAVYFCSAVGKDADGRDAAASLSSAGVDVCGIITLGGMRTATYLSILDRDGDMALAIAAMDILESISPERVRAMQAGLPDARVVVLDTNLSAETLEYCAESFEGTPIFLDPVSVGKAERARGILNRLHTIKPNKAEAEVLAGIKIEKEEDLRKAGALILKAGTKRVFISLGKDGVFYMDEKTSGKVRPPQSTGIVSATGAGDAMSAAIVWGMAMGRDTARIAGDAVLAAGAALMVKSPVNPRIGDFINKGGSENEV
jgi:pseudouridine kinase